MQVHNCLYFKDAALDSNNPGPDFDPIQISDRAFFAKVIASDGRDTGAVNFKQIDLARAAQWISAAKGPIVADMEAIEYLEGVLTHRRDIRTDIRVPGVTAANVADDSRYLLFVADVARDISSQPFGFYDLLPSGFNMFNAILSNDQPELRRAQISNDLLASFIIGRVSLLSSSLYAATNRPSHMSAWINWALWSRKEMARLAHLSITSFVAFIKPYAPDGLIPIESFRTMLRACQDAGFTSVVAWCDSYLTQEEGKPYLEALRQFSRPAPATPRPQTDTIDASKLNQIPGRKP